MDATDKQAVFAALSYLLSYPDEEWRLERSDWQSLISDIQPEHLRERLLAFLKEAEAYSPEELIETYVYTFDFGKKTNLYVTYFNSGEQRERGIELLQLKDLYQQSGFQPTDKELPDYLPLMLEFAAVAELHKAKDVFQKYVSNLEELKSQLLENESIYAPLLDGLLIALAEIGVERTVES
ncbi:MULTISPECIES: nitrate reductase molybdenum cofactor assembly chaperone [Bacillus]|uniref:Nitrate reductase molybdenum cofactor assembly chaperone n=1 Tax=Bacillus glycinifermentans TaxID=1664069 RepID=A0AAJ4D2Y5_9BACI|nr:MULTISPECIES: nitrate reductase molybdenum cofactor assembly chaperone [Bacillus]KKB73094.1 nitrate reductase [Bacillus sp. TH008]MBU8785183.1 nitrate reductase molybdenum cofactor assembly chaperone [Bacillus glycinifermentans]MDU0071368.1 nitrate reductase molybdenum cofactor assembly chaperone [Bacillus sp. IG6]MED8019331.1 nitrate reductase molybdenum cofactor assembly chaperone [Bacillus glycinifermentans]QAT65486.1 nitrate reductase molybdenum cofactor assembly chaperone [Bacillus gly